MIDTIQPMKEAKRRMMRPTIQKPRKPPKIRDRSCFRRVCLTMLASRAWASSMVDNGILFLLTGWLFLVDLWVWKCHKRRKSFLKEVGLVFVFINNTSFTPLLFLTRLSTSQTLYHPLGPPIEFLPHSLGPPIESLPQSLVYQRNRPTSRQV